MLRLFVRGSRQSPFDLCETLLTTSKCDKIAIPANTATNGCGSKCLNTSAAHLCDKKDDEATLGKSGEKLVEQDVVKDEKKAQPKPITSTMSGKENFLALLGNMKVEVTSKKRLREQRTLFVRKPKSPDMESTISMFQRATEEASNQSETLDPKLVAAATAAASTLPDQKTAQSELLHKLRQNEAITKAQKKGSTDNLGVLIAQMKVGKKQNRTKPGLSSQIHFDEDGQGFTQERKIPRDLDGVQILRDLWSGKRLNIFSPPKEKTADVTVGRPTLWDVEFANELSRVSSRVHRNGFEEMIQWTKEGKLWEYPIDNEAGLDEEKNVQFHEHIFLEKHLEEGFPSRGPVRHFMELVVAGLSKNPHLTVAQKKEHISWFRDYFQQKQDILKEADVVLN